MSHHITNKDEFNNMLKSNPKVVVDFTASWCGPCKMIAPKFEELAKAHPEIKFLKVDVDAVSDVATQEQVQAMPTFKAFHNGSKSDEFCGASSEKLEAMVAKLKSL